MYNDRTRRYQLADGRRIIRQEWVSFGQLHFWWTFYTPTGNTEAVDEERPLLPIDTEPDHIILEGEHVTTRTHSP